MPENKRNKSISNSVIRRLPRYYRFLGDILNEGKEKISSRELSERMKLTASQIRQDLNCFGGFGQQGYGYNVKELHGEIAKIIGVEKRIKCVLIGAGNMGRGIAKHINFEKRGFELIGVFDSNRQLENTEVAGHRIMHTDKLAAFCKEYQPKMAVLCIPKNGTKRICNELIALGVKAFWNFSHFDIKLHYDDIIAENVHLNDSLLTLTYNINNSGENSNLS